MFVLESSWQIPFDETCDLPDWFFPPFSLVGGKHREEMKPNYYTSEQEGLHPVPEDEHQNNKRANHGQKIIVRTPFGSETMSTPY